MIAVMVSHKEPETWQVSHHEQPSKNPYLQKINCFSLVCLLSPLSCSRLTPAPPLTPPLTVLPPLFESFSQNPATWWFFGRVLWLFTPPLFSQCSVLFKSAFLTYLIKHELYYKCCYQTFEFAKSKANP